MKTIIVSLLAVVLVLGGIIFGSYITITNTEMAMRMRVEAQQDVTQANFDKMFKVIAQTAQVPEHLMDKSREAFKEIYIPIMEGRYSNSRGGSLMSWVTESNPQFDINSFAPLYERLQIVIESNREAFFMEQKKLIDMRREHSTYINLFWQSKFLGDVQPIEIQIVTSTNTDRSFETGKEDDINIFD